MLIILWSLMKALKLQAHFPLVKKGSISAGYGLIIAPILAIMMEIFDIVGWVTFGKSIKENYE